MLVRPDVPAAQNNFTLFLQRQFAYLLKQPLQILKPNNNLEIMKQRRNHLIANAYMLGVKICNHHFPTFPLLLFYFLP